MLILFNNFVFDMVFVVRGKKFLVLIFLFYLGYVVNFEFLVYWKRKIKIIKYFFVYGCYYE